MIKLFMIINAVYWAIKACRKDYRDIYVFNLDNLISTCLSITFLVMAFK